MLIWILKLDPQMWKYVLRNGHIVREILVYAGKPTWMQYD